MLPDGTYTTPCDPEYDFFILSDYDKPVYVYGDVSPMPTMTNYFPLVTNLHYKYLSFKGYKGAIPNIGDKVLVHATIDKKIKLNLPYTFPITATSIISDEGLTNIIEKSFK